MEWHRLFGRQSMSGVEQDSTGLTGTFTRPATSETDSTSIDPDNNQDISDGTNTKAGSGAQKGSGGTDEPVIKFVMTEFSQPIFETDSQKISWSLNNDSIIINAVSWQGSKEYDSSKSLQDEIAHVPLEGDEAGSDGRKLDVTSIGASFNIAAEDGLSEYRGNAMVIKVQWLVNNTQTTGDTVSPLFTFQGESPIKEIQFKKKLEEDEDYPVGSQTVNSNNSGAGREGGFTTGVASTVSTSGMAETSTGDANDSDDSGSDGGGGGGLSTGAIAGIAVAGGVVFLALIGGLVFWMLRRRRRGQDRGHYNNPTNSGTFMTGDKEVHQVTESPHSTYSNDQHVPLSNLAGASRDLGGPSGHHRHHDDSEGEYAPYRDDDTAGHESPAAAPRADGAGTPHGVSRSVAHLVEEGMTEDEIRRLEEEERQLDDAIQRHGRAR